VDEVLKTSHNEDHVVGRKLEFKFLLCRRECLHEKGI